MANKTEIFKNGAYHDPQVESAAINILTIDSLANEEQDFFYRKYRADSWRYYLLKTIIKKL